jgi:hypothetical protein
MALPGARSVAVAKVAFSQADKYNMKITDTFPKMGEHGVLINAYFVLTEDAA